MLLTTQEAFTKVATHLLTQKCRSEVPNLIDIDEYECRYRGPEGRMCAIGCLIPDELYSSCYESKSVISPEIAALMSKIVDPNAMLLLDKLQTLHDNQDLDPEHDWPRYLDTLAIQFQLEMPCV